MFQPKTRQQVADEYGISTRTLSRWLSDQHIDLPAGLIRPADLERIYAVFGFPAGASGEGYFHIKEMLGEK